MGLLDLPAPVFAWLDDYLGLLAAPAFRLVLWGVAAAVVSMLLYRAISPQGRISRAKAEAVQARRALDGYDGEFAGAWPLMRRSMGLAMRQFGLVLWPAVAASLPILCLIVWLSTAYGHAFPRPGAEVEVRTFPNQHSARLVSKEGAAPPVPRIQVDDGNGRTISDVVLQAPVSTVHKREWWNALIGNPAGYLPDASPVDRIEVDLPRREYHQLGPWWLRSWEALFFSALVIGSIALKVGLRIH